LNAPPNGELVLLSLVDTIAYLINRGVHGATVLFHALPVTLALSPQLGIDTNKLFKEFLLVSSALLTSMFKPKSAKISVLVLLTVHCHYGVIGPNAMFNVVVAINPEKERS
jgi:hypothetical protein